MFFTRCLTKRDSALKDIRRKLGDGATVAALAVREITSERRMAYDYKVRRCNLNDQKYSVTLDGKHFTVDLEQGTCSHCTFRQQFQLPCQHIFAVWYHLGQTGEVGFEISTYSPGIDSSLHFRKLG